MNLKWGHELGLILSPTFSLFFPGLRVGFPPPVSLLFLSGGLSGRSRDGREGRFPSVDSRCRSSFMARSSVAHVASGMLPFLRLLFALASCARWVLAPPLCGGGSGKDASNKLVFPADLEVWPIYLSSSCCCHGGRGGGGEEKRLQSCRLGRGSLSAACDGSFGARSRLPASRSLNLLAERRLFQEFLPAHGWQEGRQYIFVLTSKSYTSSRCRRWRRGGFIAPSGLVPGGGGAGSVKKMKFGPDCVLNFPFRVLLAKFRDWFVILFPSSPVLGCLVIVDLI